MADSQPIPAASQTQPRVLVLTPITTFRKGYHRAHVRLRYHRGSASAHPCIDCGTPATEWSYNHSGLGEVAAGVASRSTLLTYSTDLSQYDPRCRACHVTFDLKHRQEYRAGRARRARAGAKVVTPPRPGPKPRPAPVTAADVAAARAEVVQIRERQEQAARRTPGAKVPRTLDEILAAMQAAKQSGVPLQLSDLLRPPT